WLRELGGTSQVLGLAEMLGASDEGIVGGGDEENSLPEVATLQISGVAMTQDDAEEFANRLQATGLFSEVHLGSLEHEEDDPRVVRFTLSLSVPPVSKTRATQ
ncbi:MAG: PilN domain-containing protein, partial [Calditrichaeota bacterium]|nr:PilN domain-containing protein [Calditrichota bacterium]